MIKRKIIEANDIPDIIKRFHNYQNEIDRKRTEQSFFVPYKEIKEQNYDLSISKYKEIEYEEMEYEEPSIIITNIEEHEKQIAINLQELKKLLERK